ncbi:microfibrillar-associated protein 1 [Bombyx mandarina]|uniref:Micro-fibrillar-associated protein 1 C-terminal domain-containing protein n=2 Tax=Bombyx TaxID=7090 RepID=A0A8R1WM80_BOMMO|nr:microfibrillar-associated protein 1 [Bombyx mori]XP_028026670.1 microfibrillar-associated protein 1 [Bombyx mandarina]
MNVLPAQPTGIQSTAGAIPIRNEKGEISMQKVKVQRYISGKKPDYAQGMSSSEESDEEDFIEQQRPERKQVLPQIITRKEEHHSDSEKEVDDPRLRRLRNIAQSPPRRAEHKPEIIDAEPEAESEISDHDVRDSSESEDELDEEEIERRRQALRAKLAAREAEKEVLGRDEDEEMLEGDKEESGSSDTEYTDSEEDTGPRVKPVFVRASERMTVAERERKMKQQKREEAEARKEKEERRREALKLVEETIRSEQRGAQGEQKEGNINDVCTDDENDELEYEAWKLREMKRIKRDKEEREAAEKEMLTLERLRNMTEDERRLEQRINPKVVTNKAVKGKYKFLQKYYHRGAFYLDKEEDVFKQDFSGPTLDDHFDKTVLPKVMQVKKFGRSGRTKYTHLVDQDTTEFDSAWSNETSAARLTNFRGGMKQVFEKPSAKRKHNV